MPSHFYSYSFAPNPDWSRRFSPGAEIQAYFERVAQRYDVVSRIRFGTEITRCEFGSGRWILRAADGSTDHADVVIAATGVLHHPSYPDLPGLDTFAGPTFHSARWDHAVFGAVPPDRFIPLAEGAEFLDEVDADIFQRAAAHVARWHGAGLPVGLSVNASPEWTAAAREVLGHWKPWN